MKIIKINHVIFYIYKLQLYTKLTLKKKISFSLESRRVKKKNQISMFLLQLINRIISPGTFEQSQEITGESTPPTPQFMRLPWQ